MTSKFNKKAGMDLVSTFVKSIGSESGKRIVNGKPQKPGESCVNKVKATKEAIGMIDHPYNWDNVDNNAYRLSEYVSLLAPVAGATFIGWICLPVLAGATTFALAGTGTATMTYGITNVSVILGGASTAAKKVIDYHNSRTNDINEEPVNDDELEDGKKASNDAPGKG